MIHSSSIIGPATKCVLKDCYLAAEYIISRIHLLSISSFEIPIFMIAITGEMSVKVPYVSVFCIPFSQPLHGISPNTQRLKEH